MSTRLLVVMGSGETTPTMVTTHQRVLAAVGPDPRTALLDTPYGFQENAGEITERAQAYFAHNVGTPVDVVSLRDAAAASPGALADVAERVAAASWVFAGPGSPTYLLRQWRATRLPEVLRSTLTAGSGAVVFASAAACVLGRQALPVYEVYKVGEPPHWEDGLDLVAQVGLDAVVIPHFDNAEGGTHDTRYCYLGERRLRALEEDLPTTTWVLGVDEHTALVADLAAGAVRVEGRGAVTVRARDAVTRFPAGSELAIEELAAAARGVPSAGAVPAVAADPGSAGTARTDSPSPAAGLLAAIETHRATFDRCLDAGDAMAAAEAVLAAEQTIHDWSADTLLSDELPRARDTLARMVVRLARVAADGLHDHRGLVAPAVESLLDLRDEARADERFDTADRIRDDLSRAGIEVRDTPAGTEWDYTDPST